MVGFEVVGMDVLALSGHVADSGGMVQRVWVSAYLGGDSGSVRRVNVHCIDARHGQIGIRRGLIL